MDVCFLSLSLFSDESLVVSATGSKVATKEVKKKLLARYLVMQQYVRMSIDTG